MTDDPLRWSKADIKIDKTLELAKYQVKDLKKAFDYFDSKGSGIIDPKFLKIAFRALGFEPRPAELKRYLQDVGVEPTGKLSFLDFLEIMTKKMIEQDQESEIIKSYRMFSRVGDEGITLEDLKILSRELQTDLNEEELQEMIEEGDLSMRGYVTLSDFKFIHERFYRMQAPDCKWTHKYPKNFNFYSVTARESGDYFSSP